MITITIKGISKEAHRELKRRAAAHRRSLNNEVISLLESSVHGRQGEGPSIAADKQLLKTFSKIAVSLEKFTKQNDRKA
jgi:plasmid stability protein